MPRAFIKVLPARSIRQLCLSALLLFSSQAQALHFDVKVGTMPSATHSKAISIDFFGDIPGLEGNLPIDLETGYKIYPGYFDDAEGGLRLTDDPGFQSFKGTFAHKDEIHFRALDKLYYWDASTDSWGLAPASASITLYGGIPNSVVTNALLFPTNPKYKADLAFYENGTKFTAKGISGPVTAIIDDADRTGTFHAHLDWEISSTAPAGAYLLTLQLWSPTRASGKQKYQDSEPFHILFKTAGFSQENYEEAFYARIGSTIPEPANISLMACGLMLLAWRGRNSSKHAMTGMV